MKKGKITQVIGPVVDVDFGEEVVLPPIYNGIKVKLGDSEIIAEVVNRETKAAEEYRSGKEAALQYLVGMSMWESKGAGNPSRIRELLIEELGR